MHLKPGCRERHYWILNWKALFWILQSVFFFFFGDLSDRVRSRMSSAVAAREQRAEVFLSLPLKAFRIGLKSVRG